MMSHGANGEFCLTGEDKKTSNANSMQDIVLPFCDAQFSQFQGKPKVFIITGCQGFATSLYSLVLEFQESRVSEALICLPAMPRYQSYRPYTDGSLFIHYLTKIIMEHGYRTEFQDLMGMVNAPYLTLALNLSQDSYISLTTCYYPQVQKEMGGFIKKKKLHHISPCYYFGMMFSNNRRYPRGVLGSTPNLYR